MRNLVKITDNLSTGGSVTVEKYDVVRILQRWYPQAPAAVYRAIDNLQAALLGGRDFGGWAAYLGVTVEEVQR